MPTKTPGIPLCMPACRPEHLYLWNTALEPGVTSHVTFYFRCSKCGANHLAQLDECFIADALIKSKRMGNNEKPASCPL